MTHHDVADAAMEKESQISPGRRVFRSRSRSHLDRWSHVVERERERERGRNLEG